MFTKTNTKMGMVLFILTKGVFMIMNSGRFVPSLSKNVTCNMAAMRHWDRHGISQENESVWYKEQ